MPDIAVLIPCYNEEASIGKVVRDFSRVLPSAQVYVYDNNSSDNSRIRAEEAGAVVRHESQQGKGNVVRRMFADIDADIYVLVDGDDTYDASAAPHMVRGVLDMQDMVNAVRIENHKDAFRRGHRFGNWVINLLVAGLFGRRCRDVLSGYRAFSRRFVKSFPALARGFEIETEMTIHALQLRLPIQEIETPYKERPEGSFSKLNTFRDGFKIILAIFYLLKEEKPIAFFWLIGALLLLASLFTGIPVVEEYMKTGLVPRLPTAVAATGLMVISMLSFMTGLILDGLTRGRLEAKRMAYLAAGKTP